MNGIIIHKRNHKLFQRGQFSQCGSESETGYWDTLGISKTTREGRSLRDHVLGDPVNILDWC